jgi:hypothetical protein
VTTNVSWQELYNAAMLELEHANLRGRIEAAQTAIRQAMEELASNRELRTVEETQAMADALHNLQTLQRVELRTPASATSQGRTLAER